MNIQNMTQLCFDQENNLNAHSTAVDSLDVNSELPHYRIVAGYIVPVTDLNDASKNLNHALDEMTCQLEENTKRVKSMQEQHDGLTAEIDELVSEWEKEQEKAKKKGKVK